MITKEIQARVHQYVQANSTIALNDVINTLRSEGFKITRREAITTLHNEGLDAYTTKSIAGQRLRLWRKCDEIEASSEDSDENEDVGESDAPAEPSKSSKVESEISRVQEANEKLSSEKASLFELVQKGVALKREIRQQQTALLREMASLINELYCGDSDV